MEKLHDINKDYKIVVKRYGAVICDLPFAYNSIEEFIRHNVMPDSARNERGSLFYSRMATYSELIRDAKDKGYTFSKIAVTEDNDSNKE